MSLPAPNVLVVEDEAAQREILAYNLEAEGFRVRIARDGEEAMTMISEEMPDIVVLDWMMPNVSGIEVCRRLRA
ncbi:MAG: response regulator, partial [Rhodobacteraceae bacterium]|nr:response regulator [Paracoccaceae bacterium]MCB2150558.1 response regulator [Paracoccaceae bacterium]